MPDVELSHVVELQPVDEPDAGALDDLEHVEVGHDQAPVVGRLRVASVLFRYIYVIRTVRRCISLSMHLFQVVEQLGSQHDVKLQDLVLLISRGPVALVGQFPMIVIKVTLQCTVQCIIDS